MTAALSARLHARSAQRGLDRLFGRAALEVIGGAPPGERLAEQLDAQISRHQQGILVLELDLGAEALLVLGIVDPAGIPGVVGTPLQIAEDLSAADRLAALGLVRGILEPDHASA